jgi:hypothetical protein
LTTASVAPQYDAAVTLEGVRSGKVVGNHITGWYHGIRMLKSPDTSAPSSHCVVANNTITGSRYVNIRVDNSVANISTGNTINYAPGEPYGILESGADSIARASYYTYNLSNADRPSPNTVLFTCYDQNHPSFVS